MGFFNKGAVGVRFKFKDTWLVFVNSHLAAFTNQLAQRNEMVRNTARSLIFPPPRGPVTPRDPFTPNLRPSEVGLDRPSSTTPAGETIYDAHHLIWLGDLNYRLDLARDDVLRLIESKEWDLLHRFDQLRIQRKERLAFADFEEAEIDFPPTFKFDPASTKYDTRCVYIRAQLSVDYFSSFESDLIWFDFSLAVKSNELHLGRIGYLGCRFDQG